MTGEAVAAAAPVSAPPQPLLARLVDRMNPILIKELRQSLKGRMFLSAFSILMAAGSLIAIGAAAAGGDAGSAPNGEGIFTAYFVCFSILSLAIVPFNAFTSLSRELDDRTFELVAITALTPAQIVRGKFQSTFIQAVLYLSALVPFMAFSYFLRGIDILSILLILALTLLAMVVLISLSLFAATLVRRRWSRSAMMAILAMGLLICAFGAIAPVEFLLRFNGAQEYFRDFFKPEMVLVTVGTLFFPLSYAALFYVGAVSRISFDSANRSTPVRIVLAVQWIGWTLFCLHLYFNVAASRAEEEILLVYALVAFGQWFIVGIFAATEPEVISRRVYNTFPKHWGLFRLIANVFFPGGARGMRFFVLVQSATLAVTLLALYYDARVGMSSAPSAASVGITGRVASAMIAVIGAYCYGIIFIGFPVGVCRLLPLKNPVRPGILRALIVGFVFALVLFSSFALLFDERGVERSLVREMIDLCNPVWMLAQWIDSSSAAGLERTWRDLTILIVATLVILILNMRSMAKGLKPLVSAVPLRSQADDIPAPAG